MSRVESVRVLRDEPGEPAIYGHVYRVRLLRWRWWLTVGGQPIYGPVQRPTQSWAWAAAAVAAQQPATVAAARAVARRQERS